MILPDNLTNYCDRKSRDSNADFPIVGFRAGAQLRSRQMTLNFHDTYDKSLHSAHNGPTYDNWFIKIERNLKLSLEKYNLISTLQRHSI